MSKRSKIWWSQVRKSKVLHDYKISGTDFDEDAAVPYLYEDRRNNSWKIVIPNNGKKYYFGRVDMRYKEEGALLIACIFKEGLQYTDGLTVNQFVNKKMKPWLERQNVTSSMHARKKRKLTEDTSEEEYTSEKESEQEYFDKDEEESEEVVEQAITTEEEASDEEENLDTTTDTTADVPLRLCAPRCRAMLAELEKDIFGSAKNKPFDLRIRKLEGCFKLQSNGSFQERIFAIQAKADFHC